MNIDRVARAMTAGAPRRGFTSRVMAPIEGRPSPGFTARVMTRLDDPGAAPGSAAARLLRPAFAVAAVAIAAAGALVMMQPAIRMPAAPGAPRLATNGGPRVPAIVATVVTPPRAQREATTPVVMAALDAPAETTPIYQIPALEAPESIAMRSIEPAACTIPALDAPAPLKVSDLPGTAGGSQKDFKEKP